MALFNYANREITAKVVYYGPGVCGKTTSLQYIHERIAPSQRGRLLSLATETDRTIFFDLLPLKLGEINGFKLRFQLYTVPGQVKYNKTRKLVLQGADAVVFVADSQVNRQEANIESFKNLQENLSEQNRKLEDLPLVYEYNKRDIENILSVEDLNKDLNPKNLPFFPTIATQGVGIMEALEAISKQALYDMEQRLTAGGREEKEPEKEPDEDLLMESDLTDLTAGEGEELSFSTEELDSLQLDSDLAESNQESGLLLEESDSLETKPIGYGSDVTVEEFEIREEDVAHTGTLKESEFFDLQEIEEQALRELDEFLAGEGEDTTLELSLSDSGQAEESAPSFGEDEGFTAFSRGEEASEEQALDEELLSGLGDEGILDFGLGEETETPTVEPPETEAESELRVSLDEGVEEEGPLSFDLESSLGDAESAASSEEEPMPSLTTDEDEILTFSLDEETQEQQASPEISSQGEIESLDLSASDLDIESTSLTIDEDELATFSPDEASQETPKGEIELLDLSDSDLDMTFGEEPPESEAPQVSEFESPETQEEEFPDFEITDSVKFEMQHGEELSSITPFEKQLDELSEDVFAGEEEVSTDEFQPEISETSEEEEFQDISDEWTRLLVLAKHLYHRAEAFRAQHTASDNILAIFMYYAAIETATKAVASKYETCNPTIASFHLMLESIEEETGKTITGIRAIKDNVVKIMNTIQLETAYPDDEECELAARMTERFLTSLAQELLTIDFNKLSPILARPEKE